MHAVKIKQFEGSLDLLLKLIEDHKLSINEVSLAEVADQYISYLNSKENLPYLEIAEFLAIAATLILIKSKSLLPQLTLSKEDKLSVEELQTRLNLYKIFKEAAKIIESRYQKNILWGREKFLNIEPIFAPSQNLTLSNIEQSLKLLLESLPPKELLPEKLVKETVSLENTIRQVQLFIARATKTAFIALNKSKNKTELILNFLAILELIKRGVILAEQKSPQEIVIEKV